MSKNQNFLTICGISSRWKQAKPKKNIEGETKEQKIGKTNHKLQSQNYRFASNQNANEALKLATSFNEPVKKCKLAVEIGQEFWTKNIFLEAKLCFKKWKALQGTKAKQKLIANSWKENRRESGQQAILNNQLQKSNLLEDRSKIH